MSMLIFSISELMESLMKLMFASSTLMKTMAAIWSRRMMKTQMVKSETEASDVPAGKDGESCACPETK